MIAGTYEFPLFTDEHFVIKIIVQLEWLNFKVCDLCFNKAIIKFCSSDGEM